MSRPKDFALYSSNVSAGQRGQQGPVSQPAIWGFQARHPSFEEKAVPRVDIARGSSS